MTRYFNQDLQLDDSYDIMVENGDLVIAEAPDALSYIILFRVLTDIAEWPSSPTGVANLGRFLGSSNNADTHRRMERDIKRVLSSKLDINPEDLEITAQAGVQDPSEVVLIITLKEIEYFDSENTLHSGVDITLTFSYDMNDGKIVFIDDILE